MSDEFITSNVFVYLFDETDERRREIASKIVESALRAHSASISFQVVQETLNVLTRKLPTPMTTEDAGRFLERVLEPLWRISPSLALYRRTLDLQARFRYSFYDSLIIASALDAGCT
jgi:predicted nucleic acid-binding protein